MVAGRLISKKAAEGQEAGRGQGGFCFQFSGAGAQRCLASPGGVAALASGVKEQPPLQGRPGRGSCGPSSCGELPLRACHLAGPPASPLLHLSSAHAWASHFSTHSFTPSPLLLLPSLVSLLPSFPLLLLSPTFPLHPSPHRSLSASSSLSLFFPICLSRCLFLPSILKSIISPESIFLPFVHVALGG